MSQTLNASTLLAVPLAPLAGAVLAGIFGTTFGGNWIGRRLAHTLCILGADEWEKGCDATIVGDITKFCEHVADEVRSQCPPADPCGQ